MEPKDLHAKLASQGVRVFVIQLTQGAQRHEDYWIHPSKTVLQWREDIRAFYQNTVKAAPDPDLSADDEIWNALAEHLRARGYIELRDMVADVFEGRITNEQARIVDYPEHEDQADGFGHYGWESKGQ